MLGLKWSSIDFERKSMTINHKVTEQRVNGKYVPVVSDVMKNKTSCRTLPLIPAVEAELLKQKEKQQLYRRLFGKSYRTDYLDFVCTDQEGKLLRPNFVTEHFEWLLRQYGLPHIRFHDLRHSCASLIVMKKEKRYLVPGDYMADPAVHVFNDRLYIYPSHDWESGIPENDNGDHFNMKDYHVFSTDDPMKGEIVDHGLVLTTEDIPWAGRQLWDCDVAEKDGKYYMYFPLKDQNDIFRIGVAISDRPEGPFIPQPDPMRGSYSMDPAVLNDGDCNYYMYFGGLWGGQLQRYRDNKALESGATFPADNEPSIPGRVAKLSADMLQFAEEPKAVVILDENGQPLTAGDNERRFFEASWMHKYNGKYYFSYSTGDTHRLCYAIGDNPYGPFTYQGVILTPVVGWTTHHSIVEYRGKWYLFHHDSVPSGGRTWLRSLKVCELEYDAEGKIITIEGLD